MVVLDDITSSVFDGDDILALILLIFTFKGVVSTGL
jgi:hypothetical protein